MQYPSFSDSRASIGTLSFLDSIVSKVIGGDEDEWGLKLIIWGAQNHERLALAATSSQHSPPFVPPVKLCRYVFACSGRYNS